MLFAHLGEDAYRDASFLDGRMLTPKVNAQWAPFTAVLDALPPPRALQAIFHIGHVGSTLISRLLGELPQLFTLREPAALRTLAEWRASPNAWFTSAQHAARLDACLTLWSRVWRPQQTALLKATSFASELAPALLARPDARALLLGVPPHVYLETIFAAEANRAEAVALAPSRLTRLNARLGGPVFALAGMSEGERIALAWACEGSTLAAARGPTTMTIDFTWWLVDPTSGLIAAAAHLGATPAPGVAAQLVSGPIVARYAKATEHAYSADLRATVLAQARAEHGAEIARGLGWLERTAAHPPITAALEMFAPR